MSSSFVRDTKKLLTGNSISQLIGIISIPIITRLYSVEVYGEFSSLLAISLMLSTLTTLSLHYAILIPKSEAEALKIFKLCLTITYISSFILTVVAYVFNTEIVSLLNIQSNPLIIFTVPLLILTQSIYVTITYWGVRIKVFSKVSNSKIAEGLIDRGIAIVSGFFGLAYVFNLVIARLVSSIVSISMLLPSYNKQKPTLDPTVSNTLILKKYKSYLKYNTPSMILVNGLLQLPVIIIAAYFSPVAAGLYAIANRLVNVPVSVFGNAISKTFTQKIAQDKASNNMKKVQNNTDKFFTIIFTFLLLPFSMLTVIGESLFSIVLGSKWGDAGAIASSLAYLAMTTLIVQAFGGIFDVMNKQHIRLLFHVCNFIVRIGVLTASILLGLDLQQAIIYYAASAIIMNLIAMTLLLQCVGTAKTLFLVLRNNAMPLISFHILAYIAVYNIQNLFVLYLTISILGLIWFIYLGGFNKLKQMKNGK